MNARDELAEIIQDCGEYIPGSHAEDYVNPNKAADAILAFGYRKHRIITTAEELDAMPTGSVVLNSLNEAATKHGSRWHFPAIRHSFMTWAVALPATVLYEPQP